MAATNVRAAARMPTVLIVASSSRGTKRSATTPTSGMNVAIVSQTLWSLMVSMGMGGSSSHVDDHEHDGSHGLRPEQQRTVLVDLARLHGAQRLAALFGDDAGQVDRAVDAALVDVAVGPGADPLADGPHPVDHAVDHVLVHPVGGAGDRVGDRVHDHALVQGVEVVLVDQERVA